MSELEREIADLRLFNDRMTEFKVEKSHGGWTVDMTRRGKKLLLKRSADATILESRPGGRYEPVAGNIRALLAQPVFANLEELAELQIRLTDKEPRYMPSPAVLHGVGTPQHVGDYTDIKQWIATRPEGSVIAVDGPAGAGKTVLIERLMRERALGFLDGTSTAPLILHIRSGGSNLVSIHDRISATLLEEYGGPFSRSQLSALVRQQLVVPAVDGFDELTDSKGFERAWGALIEVLRALDGRGKTLIAGRDTALDAHILKEGLGNAVANGAIYLIHMKYPETHAAQNWFARSPLWKSAPDETRKEAKLVIEESDYLCRPFFLKSFSDIEPKHFKSVLFGDPLIAIVSQMLRREGEKIAQAPGDAETEAASHIIEEFLIDVARTMVDYEVDTIEEDYLRLSFQVAFEENLPSGNKEMLDALTKRVSSFALLETAPSEGKGVLRKFSHEMIRSFFHAKHVFRSIISSEDPRPSTGLYRNTFSLDDYRIFNLLARQQNSDERLRFRSNAMRAIGAADSTETLRTNFAGFLLALLPNQDDSDAAGFVLHGAALIDAWLGDDGVAGRVTGRLVEVSANRVELRGADLRGVTFEQCQFAEVLVDSRTRLGGSLPDIGVMLLEDSAGLQRRNADEFRERFAQAAADQSEPHRAWPLLETFARAMTRHHWVRLMAEDRIGRRFLEDEHWDELKQILISHNRLREGFHDGGGAPDPLIHLVRGREFLEPHSSETQDDTRRVLAELGVLK